MRRTLNFIPVSACAALLIGVVGGAIAGPEGREAVWVGAAVAFLIQLVLFVSFFVLVFASRPLLAHGMGMLGRLLAVGTIALFLVPWVSLPAAPLLFSMVAVLFVTTLVEPLFVIGLANQR